MQLLRIGGVALVLLVGAALLLPDQTPPDDDPEPVLGWRTLFESADLLLFSAKRSGRNRVRAPGGSTGDDGRPRA